MARMQELPRPIFQLASDARVVRCGMASCAAKADNRVRGSLGRRGSDHASIEGKKVKGRLDLPQNHLCPFAC
jgi:hypothetical protein